jgi:hypothetical protein
MRIAQCINRGVRIVAEAGDMPGDLQEALVHRLGGVSLVPYVLPLSCAAVRFREAVCPVGVTVLPPCVLGPPL